MILDDALYVQAAEVLKLLEQKNKAYGSRNIGVFGKTGVEVRISDKVERLRTLCRQRAKGSGDESLRDTVRDLAGYALIWLVIDNGEWPGLEDKEDRQGGHG